jgi:hypothetical protein
MTATPAIYTVNKRFVKNGMPATACVCSPELQCTNEPPLPTECDDAEWRFVRTFVPLVHGTSCVRMFDESADNFVALEEIKSLAERPPESTHVVKLLPLRVHMQPMQTDNNNAVLFNPMPTEMRAPLFFFAELRNKGTAEEQLALLHTPST